MKGLDLTFRVLCDIARARATETIVDALNEPSALVRDKAFDSLLSRKWSVAAPRLIQYYSRLDSRHKSKILERPEELIPHLRSILEGGRYDAKCNAIQIIESAGKIKLLHLLAPVFSGIDERLRRQAGRALLHVVTNYMDFSKNVEQDATSPLAKAAARSRRELSAVLDALLRSYADHRERSILRGMLVLGGNCHRLLMTAFAPGNDRTATDLMQVLQRPETEHWDVFLARMFLSHKELVRRKADFVLRKRGPRAARDVIRRIFDLANTKPIVELSKWWGEEIWWKTVCESLDDYDAGAQSKVFTVLCDSASQAENAQACFGVLAQSKSARIRRLVIAEMASCEQMDADTLAGFLHDPDEDVQLQTTRRLLEASHPCKEELVVRQLLSPYESVRALVSAEVAQYSFRAYMRAFNSMGDRTRTLAASALVKIDGKLEDELIRALASTQAETKVKALQIAALSRPDEKLESLIAGLASDYNPHVRATAVMALGSFNSKKSEEILFNSLKDSDDRVVANAIEALEIRGRPEYLPHVKQFMNSVVPRIRGNVVKFLYRFGDPDYRGLFLDMCRSNDRSSHATAIWLSEQLDPPEAEEGLAMILRGHTGANVKERAAKALKRIREKNQTPVRECDEER